MTSLDRQIPATRTPVRQNLATDAPAGPARSIAALSEPGGRAIAVLWERRFIIIAMIALSLAGASFYLSRATPIYGSHARLFIQQNSPRIMSEDLFGENRTGTYMANQIELIRSNTILSRAAKMDFLKDSRTFATAENPVGQLLSMITVESGKGNDIIAVSAESTDPDDAAAAVNAVVQAYCDYQSERQHSTAVEVLKILEKEKEKRDAELDQLTKKMMDFKRANGVLSFENEKGNIVTQRLADLSSALGAAEMDELNAKGLADSVAKIGDDPRKIKRLLQAEYAKGVQINVGSDAGDLDTRLRKTQLELADLREQLGKDHPRVLDAERDLRDLKAEMELADQDYATTQRAVIAEQYENAKRKRETLEQKFEIQRSAALDLAGKSAEYAKLDSDERRTEKLSDLLDARIKEINVSEDSGVPTTSILESAKPSGGPIRPVRSKTYGIALLAGLVLGIGSAFTLDWFDQRLRSAEEITAIMDVQVLGLVPSMTGRKLQTERGQIVHHEPRSPIAEAYRTLRTAVYFGGSVGRCKTVLVTSPSPGDGKSTVVSNLGIAMAQAGEKVVILDADCRRPTQHKIFSIKAESGISTHLLGETTLQQSIFPSGIENLDILPCGPLPTNPAEVINSQEFGELLDALAERYDRVLIDAPPVIPITDARILAASCDETILVLRADKSNRKLAAHTVEFLRNVGASLLGVIVNDVSNRRGGYGYYSGYGYAYHYYQYGPDAESSRSDKKHAHRNGNGNGNGKPLVGTAPPAQAIASAHDSNGHGADEA